MNPSGSVKADFGQSNFGQSLFLCCCGWFWCGNVWFFPQMCTFGLSDCRVKPRRPHQTRPPGLAHDSRRTPLSAMALQHHQNSTKRPPEREKERKWRQEKEKKREILGPHRSEPTVRSPTLRGPTLRGPHFFWVCPPPFEGPTMTPEMLAKKLDWPKLVKSGWPKRDGPKSVSGSWRRTSSPP